MGNRFVRLFRAAGQERIDNRHRGQDRHNLGQFEIASNAVHYPHEIGLMEGAKPALPYDEPVRLDQHPEVRPVPAH